MPSCCRSLPLLLGLVLSSCGKTEPPPAVALNQIPIEQLRLTLKGFPGDWRAGTDQSQGKPAPEEKAVPADALRIVLPPAEGLRTLGKQPLGEALAARQSVRTYAPEPLRLEELAYLLWATQGITHTGRDESGAVLPPFRAAPSGGGRYPLETYLAVLRVDGLRPGIYRYLPREHQLVLVRESATLPEELQRACYGQELLSEAAVTFIWAAIPYRTEWKYAYLAPRLIAIEAGHVCQNLYLAAGSIGAGACALLSYHQPAIDALTGVDGMDEFAVYLACVGKATAP